MQRNADADEDDVAAVVVDVSTVDDCGADETGVDNNNNEVDGDGDDDCDDEKTVNEGIFGLVWSVLDEFGALIMIDGKMSVSGG